MAHCPDPPGIAVLLLHICAGEGNRLALLTHLGAVLTCTMSDEVDVELAVRKLSSDVRPFAFAYRQRLDPAHGPAALRRCATTVPELRRAAAAPVYDPFAEFQRLGIAHDLASPWKIDATTNAAYRLCKSYPAILCVPRAADAETVSACASFRGNRRLPVLSWRGASGQTLCRSAQPGFARLGPKAADQRYLDLIRQASDALVLSVYDCRSQAAAIANVARVHKATGGAEWGYTGCEISFCDIPNIHAVRRAYLKMPQDPRPWLELVGQLLRWGIAVAGALADGGSTRAVLVHCTDGWDRTAQLCSLAQLLLDPHFRTVEGFAVLIEKEWVAMGHKFGDRCGNCVQALRPGAQSQERSPVFVQWLWCVNQLLRHAPDAFEFTAAFLRLLAFHSSSALYGTFLGNSNRQRRGARVYELTVPLWEDLLRADGPAPIRNEGYVRHEGHLVVDPAAVAVTVWDTGAMAADNALWEQAHAVAREAAPQPLAHAATHPALRSSASAKPPCADPPSRAPVEAPGVEREEKASLRGKKGVWPPFLFKRNSKKISRKTSK